tara:strand:+ start:19474 stop:20922 length:1449 start_codon:yes stop_codon:yes gene_type:complete
MTSFKSTTPISEYKGYHGLPPLAGLHTMEGAIDCGLTVEEAVSRLKYTHWALRRLHAIFIARLAAMPIYELKMTFSLHGHYCIEHVDGIFARVREMRHPPFGMDVAPHEALDFFFDEIQNAGDTEALVLGLYEKAIPQLVAAVRDQLEVTNRLYEHPTYRKLRHLLVELEDVEAYGQQAIACLVDDTARAKHAGWLNLLDQSVANFGSFTGTEAKAEHALAAQFSATPYVYDGKPQRDERFRDSYNMGVNPEAFIFRDDMPVRPKTLMMSFKRLREIDVPEMMSSIITETEGKPLGYYVDMTRQLWDEARHAMMGEIGFVVNGIDWTQIPINFTWSLELNTGLKPEERHAILFSIEQGLMAKETGKEKEWELAVASTDRVSELIQDYDWADEILHAKIGRDWFVKGFGTQAEAVARGQECVYRGFLQLASGYKEAGLTEHRNWWPDLYTAACEHWGVEPDAHVLAYDEFYDTSAPDLPTAKV